MTTEITSVLPTTGIWRIDGMHSTVSFAIRHHAVGTFRGALSPIVGAFDAHAGRLTGEVRVDGLVLPGLAQLEEHLLSDDFFAAGSHPTLSFVSDLTTSEHGLLNADGELAIRGVTKPVHVTGSVRGPLTAEVRGHSAQMLGIDLAATIDRRDFGMTFNSEMLEGILNLGWDVEISAALELNGNGE